MKVCVVGYFGDGIHKVTDGQGIKTVELYNALKDFYDADNVLKVNTYGKKKFSLAIKLLEAISKCDNLIVVVSANGRKTIIPLLDFYNKFFHKRIFHSLIGCTTYKTLDEKPRLKPIFQRLNGNWAETKVSKQQLEDRGLTNVHVIKNFKTLKILDESELVYTKDDIFRFCTFSRVENMKGIPNVIHAVNKLNQKYGKTVCTLDIYGKIEDDFVEEFEQLKVDFGDCIKYKGVVEFEKSVDTIKHYYMLIFPTLYYTEGIPGTIIDSFSAGVPVISAEWESCFDIMSKDLGITYEIGNDEALLAALEYAITHKNAIDLLKNNCLKEAKKYTPQAAIRQIDKFLK